MWFRFWKRQEAGGPSDHSPHEPTNVFDWVRNRRTWVHLASFLFFSALIHGAGFYLFQVVYPSPSRAVPEGESVTVLDTTDPEVRAMLQRIEDRSVYLFSPSVESEVRVELDSDAVRFSPSFQNTELKLAAPRFPWSQPPSIEMEKSLPEPGKRLSRLSVSRLGGLLDRPIAPWSIMEDYLNRAEWLPEMRLHLTADEEGFVSLSKIEGELEESAQEELQRIIESTLRFLPAEESSVGILEIRSRAPREQKSLPQSAQK